MLDRPGRRIVPCGMYRIPVVVAMVLALGCGGAGRPEQEAPVPAVRTPVPPPEPPASPAEPEPPHSWVDDAVRAALDWEVMPGTNEEPEPGREAELRVFFEGHPEYQDPASREVLADIACALGTEQGHARLAAGITYEPVVVDVAADDWKVLLVHQTPWCTSDDWSYYSAEVGDGTESRGLKLAQAGPQNDVVVVKRGEAELLRLPLSGQGYLLLRPDHEPVDIGHGMSDGVLAELDRALADEG